VVQTGSDFVAFSRTINIPKRGLGESTIDKIRLYSNQAGLTVLAYAEAIVNNEPLEPSIRLNTKQRQGLKEYIQIIHQLRKVAVSCSLMQLVQSVIEATGYIGYLEEEEKEIREDRQANLNSLIAKAMEWEKTTEEPTLSKFLEELSLRSSLDETGEDKQHVSLMTIHNGKGLEFEAAFLVGVEQDLFPHANSRENLDKVEEERRLFYVGMTRAKEFLYLTHARSRFIWGTTRPQKASPFFREIPIQYIEKVQIGSRLNRNAYETPIESSSIKETLKMEEIKAGDCVFHNEFGVGTILDVYHGSAGLMYKIFFTKENQEKTLVAYLSKLLKL
jgi:DNA helicase-2/ATP-dependent DNA helicase PcrA